MGYYCELFDISLALRFLSVLLWYQQNHSGFCCRTEVKKKRFKTQATYSQGYLCPCWAIFVHAIPSLSWPHLWQTVRLDASWRLAACANKHVEVFCLTSFRLTTLRLVVGVKCGFCWWELMSGDGSLQIESPNCSIMLKFQCWTVFQESWYSIWAHGQSAAPF